jgi:hypothetical protein
MVRFITSNPKMDFGFSKTKFQNPKQPYREFFPALKKGKILDVLARAVIRQMSP